MNILALLLHDNVDVPESNVAVREMLAGFKVQSIPKVGDALHESVTVPVNGEIEVTVIVEEALVSALRVMEAGLARIV
jgi:hypothetical protein